MSRLIRQYQKAQRDVRDLYDPFTAAGELVRVTRPGGLILTEVAFLQPLHAVPYHYFNMTYWGVSQLFAGCEEVEAGHFGELSETIDWLLRSAGVATQLPANAYADLRLRLQALDPLVSDAALKSVASGVYLVVRKR